MPALECQIHLLLDKSKKQRDKSTQLSSTNPLFKYFLSAFPMPANVLDVRTSSCRCCALMGLPYPWEGQERSIYETDVSVDINIVSGLLKALCEHRKHRG